jgi:hypothetical protein
VNIEGSRMREIRTYGLKRRLLARASCTAGRGLPNCSIRSILGGRRSEVDPDDV